jgi:plastocyanin
MQPVVNSRPYRLKPLILSFFMMVVVFPLIWVAKPRAAKPAIIVAMTDMPASFEPMQMSIKVGDTVEWKNTGNQLHHVTTDPSAALKNNDVSNPPGAKPFDSGFLKPGESFRETFSVPGTYRYACAVHEAKGMNGQIIVHK